MIFGGILPHDQVMDEPGDDFCVQIAWPASGGRVPRHGFDVAAIEEPSLLDELRALSQDRVSVSREEHVILNLRATSALCALIHLASVRVPLRAASGQERYVAAAEQFIRENFASIRSLRDVAASAGIGYDHLRHIFKDMSILGVIWGTFSDDYANALQPQFDARATSEVDLELGYRFQFTPFAYAQPDLQYVVRPGGTGNIPNAFILAAQVGLTF